MMLSGLMIVTDSIVFQWCGLLKVNKDTCGASRMSRWGRFCTKSSVLRISFSLFLCVQNTQSSFSSTNCRERFKASIILPKIIFSSNPFSRKRFMSLVAVIVDTKFTGCFPLTEELLWIWVSSNLSVFL